MRGLGPRDEALPLTFSNAVRLRTGRGEDRLAQQSSTLVYAVGVASELLQQVVNATGGATLSESGSDLESAFVRVLKDLHDRYLLRFDSGDAAPGWRRVEVELKGRRGDLRYRPGYRRRPGP